MGEKTNISWADSTINFWWGCTKVSPGCANCYADTLSKRWGKDVWGKGKPREDHRKGAIKTAIKLDRETERHFNAYEHYLSAGFGSWGNPIPRRPRVFCSSMADWLDDEVPIEWLADLLNTIRITPNLDWLLLTKRPENFHSRMMAIVDECADMSICDFAYTWLGQKEDRVLKNVPPEPPVNVWIGTTVENQDMAERRIPQILQIPATVRFLSVEPMLGPVDFLPMVTDYDQNGEPVCFNKNMVDWVICGGESGTGCRPFNADWARLLRDQCELADVAFFMKQMGGSRKPFPEIPDDLMIRQFPKGGAQP